MYEMTSAREDAAMSKDRVVGVGLRIDQPYPNYQGVLGGVKRYAREHPNWRCVVDPDLAALTLRSNKSRRLYDGVVLRPSGRSVQELRRRGIPFVNTLYGYASQKIAGVYNDATACGRVLADHLGDRGFHRLWYLGPSDEKQVLAIREAFVVAGSGRGLAVGIEILEDTIPPNDKRVFWRATVRHMECFLNGLSRPVGVLVAKAWVARMLANVCERLGWRIPQDIALICMENIKSVLELSPQISCLDINYEQVGYEAGALLDRLMDGEPAEGKAVLVPPVGVIARESTGHFAVEDELVVRALRYIDAQLRQPLTVDRVAYEVASSTSTLQRRFIEALGRGVGDEIRRLRLELAKRLLHDESIQITSIAQRVGFTSRITLNNLFKRELGMSPSEFRASITLRGHRFSP